ncbi:hypothetical protein ACWNYH_00630 [Candidatus Vidania fulgoroideorum]
MRKDKKIALLFSGGIDSTITLFILKKLNKEIICIYIKICPKHTLDTYNSIEEISNCLKQVSFLSSKLKVINETQFYEDNIITQLIRDYKKGKTPNPDILCNSKLKFKHLLNKNKKVFKNKILVTGHYAISKDKRLYMSIDEAKDQTYFLFNAIKTKRCKFLMGKFFKTETIIFSKILIIKNINKTSRGICFLKTRKFSSFIKDYTRRKTKIINIKGKKLKNSLNSYHLTIGQKINISLGKKYYVISKKNNVITVTSNKKSRHLTVNQFHLIQPYFRKKKYKMELVYCKTNSCSDLKKCFFIRNKPIKVKMVYGTRICAPGQYIVIYNNKKECIFGGKIK